MTEPEPLPVLMWIISCFDKRREIPLPLYNRVFSLDWSKLSETEQAEVLQIVRDPSKDSKYKPVGFGTAVVTMTRSPNKPDRRILKYRHHFTLLSDEEFKRLCAERPYHIEQAKVSGEYIEDEKGRPTTEYEIMQYVTGQEKPIIEGDAGSVLLLGPSAPTAAADWTVATANTIAQFLQVVELICDSAWYRGRKSMTWKITPGNTSAFPEHIDSHLLEAIFPNAEETTSILGYFRQLHAADKLLVMAADCYLKHCDNDGKRSWLAREKNAFVIMVDIAPGILETQRTRRRILQLFMYGAGLLHSTSNDGADVELLAFIQQHTKERAVTIFNGCLMDLLGCVIGVYQVIKPDFEHWLSVHSLAAPDRQRIDTLFETYIGESKLEDENL